MTTRAYRALVAAAVLVLGVGCGSSSDVEDLEASASGADLDCQEGAEPLTQEMSSGSVWSMCFSVDAKSGAVLSDIHFTPADREPILLIREMALAQMEVPYDDGERLTADITQAGFGGTRMHSLSEAECAGERFGIEVPNIGDGSTFGDTPEREVLCSEIIDSGLAYRSFSDGTLTADRGNTWTLSTISKVGWYEYIAEYNFGSDGSIRPALGATGDLSPVDYTDEEHGWPIGDEEADYAANHAHNVVWRIHWGIGGADQPQEVEQFDAEPTGEMGSEAPVLDGSLASVDEPSTHQTQERRWWRVVAPESLNANGHPMSYEINLGQTDSFTYVHDEENHGADSGYDIAFTNYDECQIFATENRGGCGSGVIDYVEDSAGEELEDPVSWVAVGYHHVPRDEDQSPMEVHWQTFDMMPRDLTSTRADVPGGREDIDGQPEDSEFVEEIEDMEEMEDGGHSH